MRYEEPGRKLLKFTAVFADGTELSVSGSVLVGFTTAPSPGNLIENGFKKSAIPFTGYEPEDIPLIGRIDYRIFYRDGATQKKLMKPIIIIDGFDPGDKRKIQDSDPHPDENDAEHRSVLEIMTYLNSQDERKSILDTLNTLGYDVVIVNHPTYYENLVEMNPVKIDGGADYIERNAMAHIELYKELNLRLAANNSNEQLVIVGPSMGGQISRYALAYMEKQYAIAQNPEWLHNTRLWVSVDSPHLGANIPIGTQALLNMLSDYGNSVAAQDYVENQLGSAAAKQQLIEQYKPQSSLVSQEWLDGRTVSQGFSVDRGHPFFIEYYDHLYGNGLQGSRGYPQNLRKIAMVNGSLMGSKTFENPFVSGGTDLSGTTASDNYSSQSSKVFKMEGNANVIGHITTLENYFMPATGNYHKIAYFKKKKFLGWDYYQRYITNNNSRGNMDNVSGGWYPTQQELAHSVENSSACDYVLIGDICVNDWDIINLDHVSSFIPTVSALGFIDPDFNWNQEFDRNLTCTNEIPFDNYYGPKGNTQHTSFTEESVTWLLEELDGDNIRPAPSFYLNFNALEGPHFVCPNSSATYDFDLCKRMPVKEWQVSNNLQKITSTDLSITVEPANSWAKGVGFIKAIYQNHAFKRTV